MAIQQKPGQRGADTYPQSKEETQKMRVSIVKTIGLPKVQKSIGQALQGDPRMGMQMIVQRLADVVGNAIREVKSRYGGKVHIKLVEMMIKLAIDEVELISKALGKGPIPQQIKLQMAQEIGNALDRVLAGGGKQQPQQGQQPPQQQQPQQGQPQQAPPQQGLLGG